MGKVAARRPRLFSGGGGLVSTAADYHRFTQMLLDRPGSPGGELDGVRLLGPRTVAYMTSNHLPGGADLETFGRPLFAETPFRGVGFGLGLRRRHRPGAPARRSAAPASSPGAAPRARRSGSTRRRS